MVDLPAPRPVLWPMRARETAEVDDQMLADGRRRITIVHALLKDITPEMLDWWYHNVEGEMDYAGGRWLRYCVWHPLDHISYKVSRRVDGKVGPGTRLHIREAFQRRQENLLDLHVEVESIDARAAIIRKRVGPISILRLVNRFEGAPSGVRYTTEMTIGAMGFPGRLLNPMLRRSILGGERGQAWIRHHIEEIGTLEHFLPQLFATEAQAMWRAPHAALG